MGKKTKEVYIISAWYTEGEVTHFIFNREINYFTLLEPLTWPSLSEE